MTKTLFTAIAAAVLTACGGGGMEMAQVEQQAPEAVMAADLGPEVVTMAETAIQMAPTTTAGSTMVVGQTPAAIRTRYGMDTLTSPAQQGSGQVIVIVGAYNNDTAATDLAAFSAAHGLPACPKVANTYDASGAVTNTGTTVGSGCTLQVISVRANKAMPATKVVNGVVVDAAPPVDKVWRTETAMDIQWAHAAAPMAKIILVQSAGKYASNMQHAVQYAGKIGNVVSMSWGARESSFKRTCSSTEVGLTAAGQIANFDCYKKPVGHDITPVVLYGPANPTVTKLDGTTTTNFTPGGYDAVSFKNNAATYIAASGDWAVPMWPSVSNKVLSIGATNSAGQVDTGWSYSGGGVSAYYSQPTFQNMINVSATRATPDVSIVGDKASPVSVHIAGSWYGGYGTSVGAPIWAGIAAVTKAVRAAAGANPNIDFTQSVYTVSSTYADAFRDVTAGSTSTNTAKVGYDFVTGLGVPNVSTLVGYLATQ